MFYFVWFTSISTSKTSSIAQQQQQQQQQQKQINNKKQRKKFEFLDWINIKKIQIDSLTKSTKKIKFHNNFIRKRKKRKYI
jgi:hypothetical protein